MDKVRPRRLHEDQRGIAIVVVMLVMMVLLSLSLAVVQLSVHSSSTTQLDQRRVQSIHLAESAINEWLAPLPHTSPTHLCDMDGQTVQASLSPTTQFVLTIELFVNGSPETGDLVGCDGYTGKPSSLTSARITAESVAGTATRNSVSVTRYLQEEVTLTPLYGVAMSNALYGGTRVNISNNTDLTEFEDPNDANIYSPGNIGCEYDRTNSGNVAFNAGFSLQGSIVAGGYICGLTGHLYGNAWASDGIAVSGDLTVGYRSGGATGYMTTFHAGPAPPALYASSYPTPGAISRLGGNAQVEQACTAPNGISAGVNCARQYLQSPGTNCPAELAAVSLYDHTMCEDPAVVNAGMPNFTFNAADWTDFPPAGLPKFGVYKATSCADALAKFKDAATTLGDNPQTHYNWVIDARGYDCQLSVSSSRQTLKGNLAFITDGRVSFDQSNTWNTDGSPWGLWIVHVNPGGAAPYDEPSFPSGCFTTVVDPVKGSINVTTGLDDIVLSQRTDFSAIAKVFLYTPCGIYASNNSSINGQFIANTVDYQGRGSLNYQRVALPGVEPIGFKAGPLFVREVKA